MLTYVLQWRPSWISDPHTKDKFGKGHSNGHLLQFGFSQLISFREENLWNFSQSEDTIGPGSRLEYRTGTKNRNFLEDHRMNTPAKFGSNWPCGFGEEAWNVKSLQTTDDGRQVMAIVPMDLCSTWTKKVIMFSQRLVNKKQLFWNGVLNTNQLINEMSCVNIKQTGCRWWLGWRHRLKYDHIKYNRQRNKMSR